MTSQAEFGRRLIFLISLPRSGSTLLQRLLARHPAIASSAEPWLLLPFAFAVRQGGLSADYDARAGQIGLTEFLARSGVGADAYWGALRRIAVELYGRLADSAGKPLFLDKTTRNYLILEELEALFPDARFVFLVRNPLAVLASMADWIVKRDYTLFGEPGVRGDLLYGYPLIRAGIDRLAERAAVVRYEELVGRPEAALRTLCERLSLPFDAEMLRYQPDAALDGTLIDRRRLHLHDAPVPDYAETWRERFRSAQASSFARSFLSHLGPALVESFGYSFAELQAAVSAPGPRRFPIARWQLVMKHPRDRSRADRLRLSLLRQLNRRWPLDPGPGA